MCQSFRIPSCGFTTTCLSICQLLGLCLFLATSDCLEESCYDHLCVSPCVDGCSILGAGKRGLLAVWLCVLNFIRNHCPPSRAAVPFCMCSSELIMSSHLFSSSPTLDVISLLNFCHFSGCSGVSYCSCASHFPDTC